jgi:hypothetical protein
MILKKSHLITLTLVLLALILPLAAMYSFTTMPLTDDVRVFIGAANQAVVSPLPFPYNIDAAWELKPLGNRILWYFISGIPEQIPVQFIALIMVLLVIIPFVPRLLRFINGQHDLIFVFILLAIITPFNLFLLQAEWWAVLFSFLVLWLMLRETPSSMVTAGVISVFIISLKLSTIFMIPMILVAYILISGYGDNLGKRILPFFIGFGITTVLSSVWLFVLPHALPDIFSSISIAQASHGVTFSLVDGIVYTIYYTLPQIFTLPVLFIGMLSCLTLCCVCIMFMINNKDKKEPLIHLALLVSLWTCAFLIIFVQGEFFPYHFMVLAFPAAISVILLGNIAPVNLRDTFYLVMIATIAIFWILHCSVWSPNYPAQADFWNKTDTGVTSIENTYHLSKQPTLLYMTGADALYYWKVPSACRSIGSLPVLYNMTGTRIFNETVGCVENYRGKYVVTAHLTPNILPPVIGEKNAAEMPEKYLPNYTKVMETTNFDVYKRKTT